MSGRVDRGCVSSGRGDVTVREADERGSNLKARGCVHGGTALRKFLSCCVVRVSAATSLLSVPPPLSGSRRKELGELVPELSSRTGAAAARRGFGALTVVAR